MRLVSESLTSIVKVIYVHSLDGIDRRQFVVVTGPSLESGDGVHGPRHAGQPSGSTATKNISLKKVRDGNVGVGWWSWSVASSRRLHVKMAGLVTAGASRANV